MARLGFIALLLVATAVAACATPRGSPADIDMPPFSDEFAENARSIYRIAWTKDGYPGRREPDGSVYAHPLYGVYVLSDYSTQYEAKPSARLRKAIKTVSAAVLRRMKAFEDSLVFWYEATPAFSRAYKRYYSALTQAYYATRLHQAGKELNDARLIAAGRKAFRALLIPASRGGVLYKDVHGVSIAELPQEPNSYILNGWLSALVSIFEYAQLTDADEARRLVDESSRTLLRLLPLYDAPDYATSRYGLTGFVYVRVVSDEDVKLRSAEVTVPGEGSFDVKRLEKKPSRWQNHLLDDTMANVVISRASFPEPNMLTATVDAKGAGTATVQAYVSGRYNPRFSAPIEQQWKDIEEVSLNSGRQTFSVELPWAKFDLVVFPTGFGDKGNGKYTNVYHGIHVGQLRRMADITAKEAFAVWSKKWEMYMCRWKEMDVYEGLWANDVDDGVIPVANLCER